MIYDVRMNFRSRMLKKHLAHKTLSSILTAWHQRNVFWRRMHRKCKVLNVKHRRDLQVCVCVCVCVRVCVCLKVMSHLYK